MKRFVALMLMFGFVVSTTTPAHAAPKRRFPTVLFTAGMATASTALHIGIAVALFKQRPATPRMDGPVFLDELGNRIELTPPTMQLPATESANWVLAGLHASTAALLYLFSRIDPASRAVAQVHVGKRFSAQKTPLGFSGRF